MSRLEEERKNDMAGSGGPWLYGWFCITPRSLQCLNSAAWWLVWMCFGNVFQSMTVNGLVGVVLSTLERGFHLSSGESSFIASSYDIATIPVLIVVSSLGARCHRPRWVGWSLFILGLGAIIFTLPHFISPVYQPLAVDLEGSTLCRDRSNETTCQQKPESYYGGYYALFILGRLVMGVGATPLYTQGVTYMDDVVKKGTFSLYVAIFYAAGVVGPAIGFIGGGYLLNVFTDFTSIDVQSLGLSVSDPRWVGAWWVGFVAASVPLFLLVIPMSGFSRDLPGAAEIRGKKQVETHNAQAQDQDDYSVAGGAFVESIKEVPKILKGLATNPTFVCLTLFSACDGILVGGFTVFGPKYLEYQFSMAASMAGLLFGVISIPGGAGGIIAGGLIIKRLRMTCRRIMRTELIASCLVVGFTLLFFITCDSVPFVGVDKTYGNSTDVGLEAPCNAGCDCTDSRYEPVCSLNNERYYSPCHAGCVASDAMEGVRRYYNCSCIDGAPEVAMATSNVCTSATCRLMPLFLALFFAIMFLMFLMSSMTISATVRCVRMKERALAIGIQWIAVRLLGTMPGPVILGAVFDSTCTKWDSRCGDSGACLSYDNRRLGLYMFMVSAGVKILSAIFLVLAWRLYKPPRRDSVATEILSRQNSVASRGVDNPALTLERQESADSDMGRSNPVANGV